MATLSEDLFDRKARDAAPAAGAYRAADDPQRS